MQSQQTLQQQGTASFLDPWCVTDIIKSLHHHETEIDIGVINNLNVTLEETASAHASFNRPVHDANGKLEIRKEVSRELVERKKTSPIQTQTDIGCRKANFQTLRLPNKQKCQK